jgi:cation diffusion facilitator CzcD-associated flavoprotein CzcO
MEQGARIARRHMELAVRDPVLRAKLTPSYTMGCKRILLSDDYYPALTQPNVEVITAGIAEIRAHAIVDRDGAERPVDAIVFGTGFHVTDFPFGQRVRGSDGRTLNETWGGSPKAHVGTTVAGFPNLFIIQGPNTGLGHTSVIYMIEAQLDHIMAALRYMARHRIAVLEPRPEAQAAFVADVDARMQGTVWTSGGCSSWYLDETGRNSALWPGATYQFRRRVARFVPIEYHMSRCAPANSALSRNAQATHP